MGRGKLELQFDYFFWTLIHASSIDWCYFFSRSVMCNSLWSQGLYPTRLLCPCSLGRNTGVGCHSLLQDIFQTQGSNPGLLHCRQIPYHLIHQGMYLYLVIKHYNEWTSSQWVLSPRELLKLNVGLGIPTLAVSIKNRCGLTDDVSLLKFSVGLKTLTGEMDSGPCSDCVFSCWKVKRVILPLKVGVSSFIA